MSLQSLARGQIAPWIRVPTRSDVVSRQFAALDARLPFVFVLGLHQGQVRIAQKPEHYPPEEIAGTEPWQHDLPVSSDAHVTRVMDLCAQDPRMAEQVAYESQDFYRAHLEPERLGCYAHDLLEAYAGMCGFASS